MFKVMIPEIIQLIDSFLVNKKNNKKKNYNNKSEDEVQGNIKYETFCFYLTKKNLKTEQQNFSFHGLLLFSSLREKK